MERRGVEISRRWVGCALLFLLACTRPTTAAAPTCAPATTAGMQLCGGKPLASVRVVTVYWASDTIYRGTPAPGSSGAGAEDTSLVGDFLRSLGGSPWWHIESTYGVGGLTYDAFWANNVNVTPGNQLGAFVNEQQIVAMLQSGVSAKRIPSGANVIYVVFTGPNVSSVSGFPNSGRCADHSASGSLLYAIIPYAWQTDCELLTNVAPYVAPNDPAVDNVLSMVAHELAEAASDPVPNTGWQWVGVVGHENADRCVGNFDGFYLTANGGKATVRLGTHDFLIQNNWMNSGTGACALGWP